MSRRGQTGEPVMTASDREIVEQAEMIEVYEQGINALIDSHEPRIDASAREHMHPGWDSEITFYCKRCMTQWPCRTINDLRALYGKAHKWEPATIPYEPLVLRRPEKPQPEPEVGADD